MDSVRDEGLTGEPDSTVFVEAQKAGRALITQDLDSSDIRAFVSGTHAGVVPVRLASPGRRAVRERLVQAFDQEDPESWGRSFVVARVPRQSGLGVRRAVPAAIRQPRYPCVWAWASCSPFRQLLEPETEQPAVF